MEGEGAAAWGGRGVTAAWKAGVAEAAAGFHAPYRA